MGLSCLAGWASLAPGTLISSVLQLPVNLVERTSDGVFTHRLCPVTVSIDNARQRLHSHQGIPFSSFNNLANDGLDCALARWTTDLFCFAIRTEFTPPCPSQFRRQFS